MGFTKLTKDERQLIIDTVIVKTDEYYERTGVNVQAEDLPIDDYVAFINSEVKGIEVAAEYSYMPARLDNLIRVFDGSDFVEWELELRERVAKLRERHNRRMETREKREKRSNESASN